MQAAQVKISMPSLHAAAAAAAGVTLLALATEIETCHEVLSSLLPCVSSCCPNVLAADQPLVLFTPQPSLLTDINTTCGSSPLGAAAALSAAAAVKSSELRRSSFSSRVSTASALLCRLCSGPSTDSATSRPAPCARSWLGCTAGPGQGREAASCTHRETDSSQGLTTFISLGMTAQLA